MGNCSPSFYTNVKFLYQTTMKPVSDLHVISVEWINAGPSRQAFSVTQSPRQKNLKRIAMKH